MSVAYMPILQALKEGHLTETDFLDYVPNGKYCVTVRNWGPHLTKTIKVETNLGWHAVLYKDFAVFLVAHNATKGELVSFDGIISYQDLKKHASMYENSELHTNSVITTPELYQLIPENIRQKDVGMYREPSNSSFRRYRRKPRDPACPHDHHYHSGPVYHFYHMQPIVFIPPNTMVEIKEGAGKTKGNGFKLYSPHAKKLSNLPAECFLMSQVPQWVSLTEALFTRAILETDYIAYFPDKAQVSFTPEETATENVQIAETEYELEGWHPILRYKNGSHYAQLVSRRCSKLKLKIHPEEKHGPATYCTCIKGENQAEIGPELLGRYATLYGNRALGATGIPFNEEILLKIPKELLITEDSYWLADVFTYTMHFFDSLYYQVTKGLAWGAKGSVSYCIDKEVALSSQHIRMAIDFEKDVLVQIGNSQCDGSCERKALCIKLPEETAT